MKLLKSTATVSAMTLVSRIFGFVRDVILARSFGASVLTDAFYVAFRIPNLMRRLFAEGSFSLAFVPVFSEYRRQRSRAELVDLLNAVAGILAAFLLLVVGIGVLASPAFIALFAPGFVDQPEAFDVASVMLRITFPYALFISLTALAGGVLNSFGHFAVPAFTPVLLNIVMIAAALWLAPLLDEPIVALAWAVLAAGFVQLAFQIPALARIGLLPRPKFNWRHSGVRRIGRLMVPTLFSSSVAQINIMVDTIIASLISAGSITWLYYSDRLLEFPLGLFGIALSTVILPNLSRLHAGGEERDFAATVDWGLRLGLLIALPAAVGLAALALPIVSTLFQYGAFSASDVAMTAASVMAYAAGLPAFVAVKVLAPAFFARQDTRTPVRVAIIAMVSNMVLNGVFVLTLFQFPIAPAHAGLALASSASAYINAGLLYRALKRDQLIAPSPLWRRQLGAMTLALVLMVAAVLWLGAGAASWLDAGLLQRLGRLALCVGAGGLVYVTVTLAAGLRPGQFKR